MPPRAYYTSFMFAALGVFLLAAYRFRPRGGLDRVPLPKRLALGLAAFVGGTLGAKLPFAFTHPRGWLDAAAWLTDGKTVVTGLIGAYLAVELCKLALDVRIKTGDSFAVPLALALAVGRWGCFFNGCCYGTPTDLPWGVRFHHAEPDGTISYVPRHPTQIYESLFHLSMAIVLLQLFRYDLLPRQRLKLYLIAYGIYRFLTEFIRPEPPSWLGLTFYQWAALVLAGGLCIQWWFDARPAGPAESLVHAITTPDGVPQLVPKPAEEVDA
jgi:phosphatidylglycerol:prolipoprotein diacylglycerol transferase